MREEPESGEPPQQWLFDLDEDPSEQSDLKQKHPGLLQELAAGIEDWKSL